MPNYQIRCIENSRNEWLLLNKFDHPKDAKCPRTGEPAKRIMHSDTNEYRTKSLGDVKYSFKAEMAID